MAGVESKSFESPDETRNLDKMALASVNVGGAAVGRATFQPGWRWSEVVKPVAGTDECAVHHLGLMLSGRLHVVHSDGSEADFSAGDVYNVQPGHDAWVIGDEPVVAVEFDAATVGTYAKG
jgi:hypothetical protein